MVLVRSGGVTKVLKAYCHTNRKSYTKTVLLPQTKFPLRLENKKLVERDVLMNNVSKTQLLNSYVMSSLTYSRKLLLQNFMHGKKTI